MTDNARHAQPSRPTRHVRALLPSHIHEQLRHVAVDLDRTIADLLVEGAILVCRYYGRTQELPEPAAPANSKLEVGR